MFVVLNSAEFFFVITLQVMVVVVVVVVVVLVLVLLVLVLVVLVVLVVLLVLLLLLPLLPLLPLLLTSSASSSRCRAACRCYGRAPRCTGGWRRGRWARPRRYRLHNDPSS